MEKLISAKTTLLLDAGIEVLHQQSQEWLSDIAFWKEEIAFFYALIVKKTIRDLSATSRDILEKMEGELMKITESELDDLDQEVGLHEYYLDQMLKSNSADEKQYREKHKILAAKFESFEERYKKLKKDIYVKIIGSFR